MEHESELYLSFCPFKFFTSPSLYESNFYGTFHRPVSSSLRKCRRSSIVLPVRSCRDIESTGEYFSQRRTTRYRDHSAEFKITMPP